MLRRVTAYAVGVMMLGVLLIVLLYAYVWYNAQPYIFASIDATPTTQAAMVLGASVTAKGVLSLVLQQRADRAIALYKAHKVGKILVTGDNATLSHDEVDPVGKYMVEQGIPKGDIFLDHAGFDTYSSMYRARDVFEVSSVTIVSQPFHLPRAVFIARSLGITAYASPAQTNGLNIYYYLREMPADVKALYDILFSRVPKYLGRLHPITGDGESTWGGFSSATIWQQQI